MHRFFLTSIVFVASNVVVTLAAVIFFLLFFDILTIAAVSDVVVYDVDVAFVLDVSFAFFSYHVDQHSCIFCTLS